MDGLDISCHVLGIEEIVCIKVKEMFPSLIKVEHELIYHLRDCGLTVIVLHGKIKMISQGFETCTQKAKCFYSLKLEARCCPKDWWYVQHINKLSKFRSCKTDQPVINFLSNFSGLK